jgi:hypothetical protein
MANNDPVSGLMASMARVRNRRPDGLAAQAGTAIQAGTVPAQPKPAQVRPSSFAQVLPPPAAQPAQPVATPQTPSQTPSMAPQSLEQPSIAQEPQIDMYGITKAFLEDEADLDIPEAYVLALGFLRGVRNPRAQEQSTEQAPPAPTL